MDDVENSYGGWADHELSPTGTGGAGEIAAKLKGMNTGAELILSSPLKRTTQTARIISTTLGIPMETFAYLKERNTYGLLCGENKDEAKRRYPELVEAYDKGEEVLGYEDYDFFLKRVKKLIEKLLEFNEETLICVTHGKLLKALFKDILKNEAKEFSPNCFAEIGIDKTGNLALISSEGIDFA